MADLRTGKWVCEEKGIPTDKLISACNAGKIMAYSPDTGQEILASSQCRKKFLFHDKLYFTLITKKYPGYIAINIDDLNNFNIYLRGSLSFSDEDNSNNIGNTLNPNLEVVRNSHLSIRGYHVLHEFQRDNDGYLFFFKSKCEVAKLSDIYKYINYLYQASEIILEPKREGRFTVRFLVLEPHQKKEDIREVEFTIKMTTYEDDSRKFILDDYNDNHMSIYHNQLKCLECNISPMRDKYPRNNVFSKPYEYCYRYFHQYKLNYYKQDDKEFKNPLRLKIDFFTFDYKEYCQQTFCNENEESKSDFYRYVKSLFFDINELESTFSEDFEYTEITNDPLTYMKEKCIFLLNKYRKSKYEKIIRAYYKTITTNKKYIELHDTFFPSRECKENQNKNSYFSRFLEKFKVIAVKNNIPYIQARKFREITTNEEREEIRKSMKEQLQAFRAKNDDKPGH